MTIKRRTFLAATSAIAILATPVALSAQELPGNVRMVIGSTSTGGDTYQNSSIVAEALGEHLGINIRVDAVGATEAFKALERDSSGSTIMIFHDQSYLGHLYGVQGYEDPFANYVVGPTVAINPGNAYLVPADSPYQSMEDIFTAAANGERVRVAIQPGGVSEIGFSAMKNAASVMSPGSEDNIVPVNTGSQSDKNQAMWDDLADVINGSIQANEQFTQLPEDDATAMRFVWITARPGTLEQAPAEGMGGTSRDELLQYASPQTSVTLDGAEDFTFDKEFFFLFNPDMDPAIIDQIDTALTEIFAAGEIQERQKASFFIPNFLPSEEARAHLTEKRDTYGQVIEQISAE
ncbi:Bug family tripartite tricarboxylate transporter substrate binding protein [Pelagibacterium xiamenense]|uniref:Bug family tripartite tricarboxylate transporter substrate binding protein n=1 Tax=Pelagibacterium xiamenense TaxID=2901140 RepID=UPI001E4FE612|nr:ABC transporter substrate-binding protein [Pelagibacterium xiamenense]MCD7059706.1 ABC transporter substrate-binding protein [Pelagibacterium xiamenense]